MTKLSLSQVLASSDRLNGMLQFPVPPNWMQGRTTYGGFSSALLLAAARNAVDVLPPLRSALINFTAPIGSPPLIETEVLRNGRNVTTINTRARIEGNTAALGTFTFGKAQESHVVFEHPAKAEIQPEITEHYFPPDLPKLPIAFLENFDVRLIDGARPFAGAERGYVKVWARHNDADMRDRIEGLIAIADLLPPAIFPTLKKPGNNSSMNWIFNMLSEDIHTRDGWWLMEHQLTAGHDGYSSQVMRMWNTDGDLIVDGMQSVIIFV